MQSIFFFVIRSSFDRSARHSVYYVVAMNMERTQPYTKWKNGFVGKCFLNMNLRQLLKIYAAIKISILPKQILKYRKQKTFSRIFSSRKYFSHAMLQTYGMGCLNILWCLYIIQVQWITLVSSGRYRHKHMRNFSLSNVMWIASTDCDNRLHSVMPGDGTAAHLFPRKYRRKSRICMLSVEPN